MSALSGYGRAGGTLKQISRETGYPLRTVQRAVARLQEVEEVLQPDRGRYVLAATYFDLSSDPGARLGFQNLRFRVSNWRETPVPPCRTARAWRTVPGGDGGPREICELAWEGRQVKLVWYPSAATLEVIVAARDPIPLEMAAHLGGWLSAMLGLGRGETTEVTFIEVNSDHRELRIEPTYVELRDLPNIARVVYQRSEVLRREDRIARPPGPDGKPVTVARAVEELAYGSPLARMERILAAEVELARLQAPAAPRRTAPSAPSEARDQGFG